MPNLKDIRRRIRSVKSTQKITQAMKMVAAAKVKRAENRVKAARPYSVSLQEMFASVLPALQQAFANGELTAEASRYARMLTGQSGQAAKSIGILVIGADRGLCGAYNANILRQAFRLEQELLARGLTPKFFLVGNKVVQAYKRYSQSPLLGSLTNITAAPGIHDANHAANTLVNAYLSGEIDRIEILSTRFISMIAYKLEMDAIFPIESQTADPKNLKQTIAPSPKAELLLSPDPVTILDQLLPMYLKNRIYSAMLESSASELAARMTAMSNATKNAGDMINRLTIQYNKLRQAAITQEILEIVSGAQALQ